MTGSHCLRYFKWLRSDFHLQSFAFKGFICVSDRKMSMSNTAVLFLNYEYEQDFSLMETCD